MYWINENGDTTHQNLRHTEKNPTGKFIVKTHTKIVERLYITLHLKELDKKNKLSTKLIKWRKT